MITSPDTLLLEELAAIDAYSDERNLRAEIDIAFGNLISGCDYNRVRLGCLHKVPASCAYAETFNALPYGPVPR